MQKILIVLLLLVGNAYAASEPTEDLSKAVDSIQSLKANFVQTVYGKKNQVLQRSGGIVEFKKPNSFRWQIVDPDPALLISDGKTLWNYDEQLEQVTVEPAATEDQVMPLSFLAGDPGRHFTVEQLSATSYRLTPKTANASFSHLEIFFMRGKIAQLHLHDNFDQISVFEFMQVQNNPQIDNARFNFVPPPGVDVIGDK